MSAYYSEWEQSAAAWIEALIDRGVVSAGPVDTRDLEDVLPSDLKGFERVHLCAGIGTWDYALTLAGWPRGREVWTVSAPCQPFSAAGKGLGTADSRHLWPAVDWLIGQRRPHTIFGEQVASKDGREWFDHVQADLEARGYAVGAAVTPAAGYGAPHERHRNYFVATLADDDDAGPQGRWQSRCERALEQSIGASGLAIGLGESGGIRQCESGERGTEERGDGFRQSGDVVLRLADTGCQQCQRGPHEQRPSKHGPTKRSRESFYDQRCSSACGLAHNPVVGRREERADAGGRAIRDSAQGNAAGFLTGRLNYMPGPTNGFWRDADWLGCRDDRWRPVEPGTFPLAHGSAARVGRLRGYGNGIVLGQAVAFIQSFLEGEADFFRLRGL